MQLKLSNSRPLFLWHILLVRKTKILEIKYVKSEGSGCGSVVRAVACTSRGLGFESSHWQIFTLKVYCRKDEWKKKVAGVGVPP